MILEMAGEWHDLGHPARADDSNIGQDATEEFEDTGHSEYAREVTQTLLIGVIEQPEVRALPQPC